ncbi:MAG: hypothetical protein D6753_14140 [Planctomycetota bacterium]|nr:MAG: hypothetical protein D6753_14140 [Planctomycetota bacterium]
MDPTIAVNDAVPRDGWLHFHPPPGFAKWAPYGFIILASALPAHQFTQCHHPGHFGRRLPPTTINSARGLANAEPALHRMDLFSAIPTPSEPILPCTRRQKPGAWFAYVQETAEAKTASPADGRDTCC